MKKHKKNAPFIMF